MVSIIATAQAQEQPSQDEKPSATEQTTQKRKRPDGMPERGKRLSPAERAERQTAALTEALDLTEEQQASINKINQKYADEFTKLRQEDEEARKKARAAMTEMKQKKEAELKEVLTEEQIEKYQTHQEENRKEHRGRRHRGKR